jgi:branched-chain amino acid transport system ATP-binding protein
MTEPGTADPLLAERPAAAGVLRAVSVSAGYASIAAIHGVDLEVRPGEIVALLGANGAGKTTTLLALAGGGSVFSGDVLWDGKRVNSLPLHRRARSGIGFVSEERSVFMGLSVRDNLKLGAGTVQDALGYCPELGPLLGRRAGLLSGGEQQMLTLARALAAKPRVLLVDELSLGLAPQVTARLFGVLRAAVETSGLGVLLVEQQARRALAAVNRAYVLRHGEVVLAGTAEELRRRHADLEALYLTARAAPGGQPPA